MIEQLLDLTHKLHDVQLTWRKRPYRERQIILSDLSMMIAANQNELAALITSTMKKSGLQAHAEIKKSIEAIDRLCDQNLAFLEDQYVSSAVYEKTVIKAEPLGVLLALMPWNFPVWQVIRMIIPALITGNVILLKHSEICPEIGDYFEKIFTELDAKHHCGLLLRHQLFEHQFTENVIASLNIHGVSLTGSVKAGEVISKLCSRYFKKCVLELGGIDAALVMDDADLDLATERIAKARLMNSGQVCISTKRVFVPKERYAEFLQKIKKQFDRLLSENDPYKKWVTELAHERFLETYNKQIDHLEKTQSKIYSNTNESVEIAIFLINHIDDFVKTEEIFGPCLQIYIYNTLDVAIKTINDTPYGLAASVYGTQVDQALFVASQIQVGQVAINDLVKTDINIPFSGMKKSGMGYELGEQGFKEFVRFKAYSM